MATMQEEFEALQKAVLKVRNTVLTETIESMDDVLKKLGKLSDKAKQRREVERRVQIWAFKRKLRQAAPWIAVAFGVLVVGVLLWK